MVILPEFFQNEVGQYYLAAVIMFIPVCVIYKRAGFSPLWSLFLCVPMFGYVICAGILTFQKWPVLTGGKDND